MKREEGYYWCFFDKQTGWVIGEWDSEYWTVHHSENEYNDEDFQEIDERRIERQPIVDNAKHDIKPPTEEELSAMIHNPQPPHTNQFY